MLNFENLDKMLCAGKGKYEIPEIKPVCDLDLEAIEWIPFNYAKTVKNREEKGIHFYVDDYQFTRLWNRPNEYIPLLSQFAAVTTPDFSTYTDMPVAMQIYNHYRKHWLGAYWQASGLTVIPTISWSAEDSYEWCFDGEPQGGIISISSVGTQKDKRAKAGFKKGLYRALDALCPTQILWYGNVCAEVDTPIIAIQAHYKDIEKRRVTANGRAGRE